MTPKMIRIRDGRCRCCGKENSDGIKPMSLFQVENRVFLFWAGYTWEYDSSARYQLRAWTDIGEALDRVNEWDIDDIFEQELRCLDLLDISTMFHSVEEFTQFNLEAIHAQFMS